MKRQHAAIILSFLWFAVAVFAPQCFARDMIKGQITDAIRERVGLSTGDNVTISLGKNHGLIKGDVGRIFSSSDGKLEIGRCVVQEGRYASSTCQIIESLREIGRGDTVLFAGVDYRDRALFLPIIDLLDSSVKPYPAHARVRILIHELFDGKNNITQFSEKLRGELNYIASQKKRIASVDSRELPDFSYYPTEYGTSAKQVKNFLRNNGLDLMITGTHVIKGSSAELTFQRIGQEGSDRVIAFPLSAGIVKEGDTDQIVLPYVKREKPIESICSILYKPRQYVPLKEEKSAIIKEEAGANPFKELNLKRVEFNIISPVQFKVTVDGTVLNMGDGGVGNISLKNGSHRIHASFRRGYYSGESLLHTSAREHMSEVRLDLNKSEEVVVEIAADPVPDKGEYLAFKVYRKAEREKHTLRPIHRLESEKVIETFVE